VVIADGFSCLFCAKGCCLFLRGFLKHMLVHPPAVFETPVSIHASIRLLDIGVETRESIHASIRPAQP
jgi:hypothetical protein